MKKKWALRPPPARRRITWSPSVALVPTRQCFNACGYCSFHRPPPAGGPGSPACWPQLARPGPWPPAPHQRRPAVLAGDGALGQLNPSMGLMLEGLGPAYDRLHRQAPSMRLELRLGQLEQAGRLGIPFTTGLLLGVGESRADRRDALELLALLLTVAEARAILPGEVHLQLPPNLWPADRLTEALEAGIDDLGGIDIGDVINPAYPQPCPQALAALQRAAAAAALLLASEHTFGLREP